MTPAISTILGSDAQGRPSRGPDTGKGGDQTFGALLSDLAQSGSAQTGAGPDAGAVTSATVPGSVVPPAGPAPIAQSMIAALAAATGATTPSPPKQDVQSLIAQVALAGASSVGAAIAAAAPPSDPTSAPTAAKGTMQPTVVRPMAAPIDAATTDGAAAAVRPAADTSATAGPATGPSAQQPASPPITASSQTAGSAARATATAQTSDDTPALPSRTGALASATTIVQPPNADLDAANVEPVSPTAAAETPATQTDATTLPGCDKTQTRTKRADTDQTVSATPAQADPAMLWAAAATVAPVASGQALAADTGGATAATDSVPPVAVPAQTIVGAVTTAMPQAFRAVRGGMAEDPAPAPALATEPMAAERSDGSGTIAPALMQGSAGTAQAGAKPVKLTLVGTTAQPAPARAAVPPTGARETNASAPSTVAAGASSDDAGHSPPDNEKASPATGSTFDLGASQAAASPHTETVAAAATVQTIAHAVTTLAAEASDAAPPVATPQSDAATPKPASAPAPARSLTLQLSPADLGNVTVHLRLRDGALDVQLAVDDQKTLGLIAHARDALASAIGDGATPLASLVIQGSGTPSPQTADSHDLTNPNRAGQDVGTNGSGGRGAGGGDTQRQSRGAPSRDPRPADARGTDGLFV